MWGMREPLESPECSSGERIMFKRYAGWRRRWARFRDGIQSCKGMGL